METLIIPALKATRASLYTEQEAEIAPFSQNEVRPVSVALVGALAINAGAQNYAPQDLAGWTFRCGLGNGFLPPVAGTFNLSYVRESTSVTYTTDPIPYNATAQQISDALNALPYFPGVEVSQKNGIFIITFEDLGARTPLGGNAGSLAPLSILEFGQLIAGDDDTQEVQTLRITQNPGAYCSLATASAAAAAPVTVNRVGGGGYNHKITVGFKSLIYGQDYQTPYGGKWTATVGGHETALIDWTASASDVQTALENLTGIGAGNVQVAEQADGSFIVAFQGTLANTNMGAITTDPSLLSVIPYLSGLLDLRTPGIDLLLGEQEETSVFFEIEGTPPGGAPQQLLFESVTLRESILSPGNQTPQPYDQFFTEGESDARYPLKTDLGTAATRNVGTAEGNVVAITNGKYPAGDGSLLTNLPSGPLTAGLVTELRYLEGQGRASANSARSSAIPANLFVSPELFKNDFWGTTSSAAVTENAQLSPFSGRPAALLTAGGSPAQAVWIPAAGPYVQSWTLASKDGVAYTMQLIMHGNSVQVTVPATGEVRVSYSQTYSAAGIDVVQLAPIDGGTRNVLVINAQMERGTVPSKFISSSGNVTLYGPSALTAQGADFTAAAVSGKNPLAVADFPQTCCNGLTIHFVFCWPTASAAPDTDHIALVSDNSTSFYAYLNSGAGNIGVTLAAVSTFARQAANVHDGPWHLGTILVQPDGFLRLRFDGREVAYGPELVLPAVPTPITPFLLNKLVIAALDTVWALPAKFCYTSVYNTNLSNAQLPVNESAVRARALADHGVTVASTRYFAAEGDSITATAPTGSGITTVPYLLTLPAGVNAFDWALSASQIADMTNRLPALAASFQPGQLTVLYIGPLHNDMDAGGVDGPTFVARIKAYCLAAKAAATAVNAPLKIILCDPLYSGATASATRVAAARAGIAADPSFWDFRVDLSGDAIFGDPNSINNTTYFNPADKTHPLQPGQARLAGLVQPVVTAAFAA